MDALLEFEKPIVEIEAMIEKLKKLSTEQKGDFSDQIAQLEERCQDQRRQVYENLTPWQVLQIARFKERPILQDYLSLVFDDFIELHGDRYFSDDRALIGGFATIEGQKVVVIGHNKGKNVEENIERNFGQAKPDGYRKALRLMKLAEKYGLPVITLVDTQGAFPGKEGEERGQHEAIARNLTEMARLSVPIISVVTGEGGSGGAIGIAVGDVVMMMQYSVYSVISAEGCAAILWRDNAKASVAAQALKITAPELKKLGIIDEIIEEPVGGAHKNYELAAANLKNALIAQIKNLSKLSSSKLINRRFEKFSKMGQFTKG